MKPHQITETRVGRLRLFIIVLAIATPAIVFAIQGELGLLDQVVLTVSTSLLAAVVATRVLRLLRSQERRATAERALTNSMSTLAAMETPQQIVASLPTAISHLFESASATISRKQREDTDLSLPTWGGQFVTISGIESDPLAVRIATTLVTEASRLAESADHILELARLESDRVAANRIAQNEKRFRALVQHASDIIIVVSEVGEVQYVSEPVVAALGYEVEEIEGKTLNWVVHENDIEAATDYFAATLNGLARDDVHEFRAVAKDGEVHLFETVMTDMRDTEAVEGIVLNCSDVTDRRVLERDLQDAETIDMLTLLLNRNAFIEETDNGLRRASIAADGVAIAIIDLDNFREINEGLGPVVADLTLVEVSQRLRRAVRVGDIVARLNGDEFAVLMTDSISSTEAVAATERILEQLVGTTLIHGREVQIEASAGVARDADGEVLATRLLRNADTALGHAKVNARGKAVFFEESMAKAVTTRLEIRNKLEKAIENDELRLVYQPIIDAQTENIVSMEALSRWRDGNDDISPGVFIPIAEESNLIGALGEWAFREVCSQVVEWEAAGWDAFSVSVNMSGHQLHEEGITARLQKVVDETGVDPARIIICLLYTSDAADE